MIRACGLLIFFKTHKLDTRILIEGFMYLQLFFQILKAKNSLTVLVSSFVAFLQSASYCHLHCHLLVSIWRLYLHFNARAYSRSHTFICFIPALSVTFMFESFHGELQLLLCSYHGDCLHQLFSLETIASAQSSSRLLIQQPTIVLLSVYGALSL